MSAYVVIEFAIDDPEAMARYREAASPTVAAHGGRYVARGGRTVTLEGDWSPERLVILEFETLERAEAWWKSAEYQAARDLRQNAGRARLVAIESVG